MYAAVQMPHSIELVLVGIIVASCMKEYNGMTDLYLLTLLPYPDCSLPEYFQPSYTEGEALYTAALLATELINNETDLLGSYQLKLLQGFSGCHFFFRTMESFVEHVFCSGSPSQNCKLPVVGVIGPACSRSTLSLANFTNHREVALINVHISAISEINDRTLFPYSFGMLDSAATTAKVMVSLLLLNSWTNVSVFYDDSRLYYTSLMEEFNREIESAEMASAFVVGISNSNLAPINAIVRKYRIIFLLVDNELLNEALCRAYYNKYAFPTYQFVIVTDSLEFTATRDCNQNQTAEIASGAVLLENQVARRDEEVSTESGISLSTFQHLYTERLGDQAASSFAPSIFDAVWSFAKALNASADHIDLSTYRQGQQNATDIIEEQFQELEFEGLSGRIEFNESTGRINQNVNLFVIRDANRTFSGYYSIHNESLVGISQDIFISDQFELVAVTPPKPLVYVMMVIILIALTLAVSLNIITCVFRERKSIKASSIKVNQVIYFGCYVLILSLIFAVVNQGFTNMIPWSVFCTLEQLIDFSFSIGLTLIFAGICARIWRLYRIFIHFNDPGRLISDPALYMQVLLILSINICFILPPFFVDQYVLKKTRSGGETTVIEVCLRCERKYFILWFLMGLAVSSALLSAIFVFGCLTRKIPQKNFKTKCIMYQSYILTGLVPLLLGLYLISSYQNCSVTLHFTTFCVMLLTLVFIPCMALFLPPILYLSR